MFTSDEAAQLIRQGITYAENSQKGFVLCRIMKSVGMLDLANQIAHEFGKGEKPEIVGIRPGERLNETLVSDSELSIASITDNKRYITLYNNEFGDGRLTHALSSLTAEYMSEQEMRALYLDMVPEPLTAVPEQTQKS